MITAELIAALDDIIQAGAQASAKIRAALEHMAGTRSATGKEARLIGVVSAQQGILEGARAAARTEQTVPQLLTQARDAVSKISDVAAAMGDSTLANSLKMRVQSISTQMKAAGVGMPWLTILGVGAGAVALYYLWKSYSKTRKIASFVTPDPEPQIGPRVRMMGKSLSAFRAAPPCRQLGRGKRLGGVEKYEFEPETRLEGIQRGSRRRTRRAK